MLLISFLVLGSLAVVTTGVVALVKSRQSGNRALTAKAHAYERALRTIANGSSDPANEAALALWEQETKELEK